MFESHHLAYRSYNSVILSECKNKSIGCISPSCHLAVHDLICKTWMCMHCDFRVAELTGVLLYVNTSRSIAGLDPKNMFARYSSIVMDTYRSKFNQKHTSRFIYHGLYEAAATDWLLLLPGRARASIPTRTPRRRPPPGAARSRRRRRRARGRS